jgi:copper(I)-binding protein
MMRATQLAILLTCLVFSGCSKEALPPLVASDVVITAPMPGNSMSAGYLSITNNTSDTVTLSHVESTEYDSVEIHESVLEDGIAKMRRLGELTIPAKSTIKLEPGGKHLMLMRPSGTSNQVTLSFYSKNTLLLGVTAPLSKRNN